MPTYPTIHGIRFSNDDLRFLDLQAKKHDALKAFVVLFGLELLYNNLISAGKVQVLSDVLDHVSKTAITILTPGWGDAAKGLMQIRLAMAKQDTVLHTIGRYMNNGEKLKAPAGKAKEFFTTLARYYGDLGGSL